VFLVRTYVGDHRTYARVSSANVHCEGTTGCTPLSIVVNVRGGTTGRTLQ
jgi:hypothetical protein